MPKHKSPIRFASALYSRQRHRGSCAVGVLARDTAGRPHVRGLRGCADVISHPRSWVAPACANVYVRGRHRARAYAGASALYTSSNHLRSKPRLRPHRLKYVVSRHTHHQTKVHHHFTRALYPRSRAAACSTRRSACGRHAIDARPLLHLVRGARLTP